MRLATSLAALLMLALAAAADATGTITGQILNPATGEYVRDAQIRIEGTDLRAVSEAGGFYRLNGVPAGPRTLVAAYTGYETVTAAVDVAAGATVVRNLEMQAHDAGGPIKLSAFTVSSEREGNAKAIMQQRNSMNITNTVAADVFGDVSEGNIGEFLKYIPGVSLNYAGGDVRTVSLRGLGAEYTTVKLDGVALASVDAGGGANADARAFTFEQISLNSMESIEISKTISADVDANAPAGTINLKTKRAFDRAGRRVTIQANVVAFSENFTLGKDYGPADERGRKILPGGVFKYSDVFFNKRLGVVLNISESNSFAHVSGVTVGYNQTPTAADPRPAVVSQIQFNHSPKTSRRHARTFTTDYRFSPHLTLSFGFIYSLQDLWSLSTSPRAADRHPRQHRRHRSRRVKKLEVTRFQGLTGRPDCCANAAALVGSAR